MVRNYTRKTGRWKVPDESFEKAYEAVKTKIMSLQEEATAFEIDKTTLFRFIRKKYESQGQTITMGYAKPRKKYDSQGQTISMGYAKPKKKI